MKYKNMIKVNINEAFHSIQGEGATIGHPILFIRLAGCNLHCLFCDTQYHTNINYNEINDELDKLLRKHKSWCITGGEPLLQQDKILELIREYDPEWVEIETNGTIKPSDELLEIISQWNISPKNPEQNEVKNIEYKFLDSLAYNINYIIKFVYTDKQDENFIETMIDNYYIDENRVFIMTEGATKKEQEHNMPNVIEYCLKNEFNFSPRLHVLLWNNRQGV